MDSFAEKYHQAPDWQKERFNKICDVLEKGPKKVTLDDSDLSHILWLAGWDNDTETKVTNLYKKILKA